MKKENVSHFFHDSVCAYVEMKNIFFNLKFHFLYLFFAINEMQTFLHKYYHRIVSISCINSFIYAEKT